MTIDTTSDTVTLAVRLPRETHALAIRQAADEDQSIARTMADLLTEWVGDELPPEPRRAPARESLVRTLVSLSPDVRLRIERKAALEGRSISQVVARLLVERA